MIRRSSLPLLRRPRTAPWLAGLALAVLSGCASPSRQYDSPRLAIPVAFKQSLPELPVPIPTDGATGGANEASPAAPAALERTHLREWWQLLGDPGLDTLVDRALANNADLHIATARLQQGWARAHQARAGQFPTLDLSYQGITQKPNATAVGELATSGSPNYHVLQLSSSVRVDLWGERSAVAQSAALQMWQLSFVREDTRRTLVASTVSLYIDYLSLNDRIRIARDTARVLQDMLQSVQGRMEGGEATATDYEQQRAAVHAVAATIPVLELQRDNASNALALLLGVAPSALALPSERGLADLHFPQTLPAMSPRLLLNRPDVHAAELRLQAAHADIDVAHARLLPSLDLTAQAGYGAQWLSQLITPSGFYWSAIAGLSTSLFDHGARADDVEVAQAVHEELVEAYVQTLYGAIRETEDALAAVRYHGQRLADQRTASEAARAAWHNSTEAYGAGAIDYLTLLETQRSYFTNLDTLQGVERDRMKGLVALFAALGGGTTLDAEEPPSDAEETEAAAGDLGDTPAGPSALLAGMSLSLHTAAPAASAEGDGDWVVALAGLQDDDGSRRLVRDLVARFPDAMNGHAVIAREYQRLQDSQHRHAAWFRVFVTGFAQRDDADAFCAALAVQMQRAQPLPVSDPAFRQGRRRRISLVGAAQ